MQREEQIKHIESEMTKLNGQLERLQEDQAHQMLHKFVSDVVNGRATFSVHKISTESTYKNTVLKFDFPEDSVFMATYGASLHLYTDLPKEGGDGADTNTD